MSKANALAGLIGNYGDSDEESDNEMKNKYASRSLTSGQTHLAAPATDVAGIHPAPVPHCPWSACYDEGSGFTYYWNQNTNEVTWEAPQEYLFALKLAQKNLHSSGSAEVSAAEWQMYQQALAEKQKSQVLVKQTKAPLNKQVKNADSNKGFPKQQKNGKSTKKRPHGSDDEDIKIELITSYHNSDSESNDESASPDKAPKPPILKDPVKATTVKAAKNTQKKQKTKAAKPTQEYGPILPPNQNYTLPIGPEIPSHLLNENKPKSPDNKKYSSSKDEYDETGKADTDDQDENSLLQRLKDKAKLLEKLGGELPSELKDIIDNDRVSSSPQLEKNSDSRESNIDDLLNEIETKEFLKVKKANDSGSGTNSPIIDNSVCKEIKPLFPCSKAIQESAISMEDTNPKSPEIAKVDCGNVDKKNMYLMDVNEPIGNAGRKKLRICNSVLPERKKIEVPSYTTKYSEHIEGFSGERTGLGFTGDDAVASASPKNTISYGNGLTFTKGEILNEKDAELEDLTDLVEAKLKFLNQLQPCAVTAVQEMMIQLQTLVSARLAGALSAVYLCRWARSAAAALHSHEATAAPPGWTCCFQRSEGRYSYRRESDGFTQWEYPAVADTDMEICTTPPPPAEQKDEAPPPPSAPPSEPCTPPPPPLPVSARPLTPPPPPAWAPPPPAWDRDPLPPGCDEAPPLLPKEPPKKEIGDELASFYSDIAELEKETPPATPPKTTAPPKPPAPPKIHRPPATNRVSSASPEPDSHDRNKQLNKTTKKKTKVKISSSVGMKHKTVSSLVAKWQQVAEEIDSD